MTDQDGIRSIRIERPIGLIDQVIRSKRLPTLEDERFFKDKGLWGDGTNGSGVEGVRHSLF